MSQDDLTDELNAYLAVLEKARGRSAKAANRIVNRPPQTLVSLATAHGLEDDQVNAVLAAIITMPHERIAVRSAVLLVPRRPSVERASAEAVVEAVTRLPAGVRAVLTRWLLTCHDLWSREVKQLLHDSYAVWFGLVERAERAELCRLLYLLTRRADVTPWRAKILSAVMERDLDPAIIALAELYARFAPSWVKFPALCVFCVCVCVCVARRAHSYARAMQQIARDCWAVGRVGRGARATAGQHAPRRGRGDVALEAAARGCARAHSCGRAATRRPARPRARARSRRRRRPRQRGPHAQRDGALPGAAARRRGAEPRRGAALRRARRLCRGPAGHARGARAGALPPPADVERRFDARAQPPRHAAALPV